MSSFAQAMGAQDAVKTVNIYFAKQHAVAAQELSARITADNNGQAFATRTQGNLVRTLNDVATCNAVIVDAALGAEQIKLILELHDTMKYPFEVHTVEYNTKTKVFEMQEKADVPTTPAPGSAIQGAAAGDTGGPRPSDPPATTGSGNSAGSQQRARGGAGRRSSGETD